MIIIAHLAHNPQHSLWLNPGILPLAGPTRGVSLSARAARRTGATRSCQFARLASASAGAPAAARTGAQPTGRTCASCSRMRKHVAQVMRQPTMSIRTCAAAAARIESRSVPLHARQPTCYPRTRPCEDDTEGPFRGALMQGPSAGQLGMHAQRARAEAGHRGLRRAWIDVPALAGSTPILARTKGSPVPASTDLARAGPPSAAARR